MVQILTRSLASLASNSSANTVNPPQFDAEMVKSAITEFNEDVSARFAWIQSRMALCVGGDEAQRNNGGANAAGNNGQMAAAQVQLVPDDIFAGMVCGCFARLCVRFFLCVYVCMYTLCACVSMDTYSHE